MFVKTLKKEWYIVALLLIPFAASVYFWDQLPDQVPTHFNLQGEVDDWGPKWINAFMMPVIGLVTYFSLIFLPFIDPKKRIASRQKPIAAMRIILSLFMVVIYGLIMAVSLGNEVKMEFYVMLAVGLLIMVVGNYMNSVKQNYFIGVKTPWTLENEEVWKKTHRLTSKLWTAGGALLIIIPLLFSGSAAQAWLLGIVIAAISVLPILYSYLIYQKLKPQD